MTLALCAWSCRTHSRDWTTTTVFFDIGLEGFDFAPDPPKEEHLVNGACSMNRGGAGDMVGERRDGDRTSYDWATYPFRLLRWYVTSRCFSELIIWLTDQRCAGFIVVTGNDGMVMAITGVLEYQMKAKRTV